MDIELSPEQHALFDYVEDNDLWRHALPDSKAFTAGLAARNIEYDVDKNPQLFAQLASLTAPQLIAEGKGLLEARQALVRGYANNLLFKEFKNLHETNSPARLVFYCEIKPQDFAIISELGHQLAIGSPSHIGAVVLPNPDNNLLRVSLRSLPDTDCTPLAKRFGGGGHAQACGFSVTREEWDKL
jgi:nanoRNase/pAp phosphatase (c-di-AMP/oligoRNAs hydrolase)